MIQKRWWIGFLILMVSACSNATEAAPTPLVESTPVTIPATSTGGNVVASGIIVPAEQASLGLATPAQIQAVHVKEGQQVESGQVLITLVGQEVREAAVAAAEMELVNAQHAWRELHLQADQARAQTQLDLANARDALREAEYMNSVRQQGHRASKETIDATEANLVLAEYEVDEAKDEYDRLSGQLEDNPSRALALSNLAAARQRRDSIQRNLNWYKGHPTEIEQEMLDAEISKAEANVAILEQKLEKMEAGPDLDLLAAAEARLKNAEAQVAAAQAQAAGGEIRAPFKGVIAELLVNSGEAVMPGQTLLVLCDLEHLRVETVDLSERDIDQVVLGQSAAVFIEPLLIDLVGEVVQIAPSADTLGGDVVYTVTLDLDEQPAGLRWGMSVEVEIETD
jgi:multidrug efflux pump subunit AcrA (membrane-fusion protein)